MERDGKNQGVIIMITPRIKRISDRSSTLANLFNDYFVNITSTLKLKQSPTKFSLIPNLSIRHRDHMSMKKI